MASRMFAVLLFVLLSLGSLGLVHYAHAQSVIGDLMPCVADSYRGCGTDTGECRRGVRVCENGYWSECRDYKGPSEEICGNGKDEDCNGVLDDCIDNTFGYILMGAGAAILVLALVLHKLRVVPEDQI
jgi:hypothetical protein